MIVYRFERNGIGPYVGRSSFSISRFQTKKSKTEQIASKKFDQLLLTSNADRMKGWQKAHKSKHYIFGCSSKEQLRAYFGGSFKELFKQGYRIKRYKVPDNEIIDMAVEVAFPVKYHKLQSLNKIKKVTKNILT